MKLKLVLLMGCMFSAAQAAGTTSTFNQLSQREANNSAVLADDSVEDFFKPSDSEEECSQELVEKRVGSSLALLKSPAPEASATAQMTDDERLAAAIKASIITKAFQDKQTEAAKSPKSSIGSVAFEVVMRNAHHAAESGDLAKLQGAVDNVRAIQRSNILTDEQHERVSARLVDLTCALSVITNHETLGAR